MIKSFEKSRKVLPALRKSLVNNGMGNKPQATRALTDTEEDEEMLVWIGERGTKTRTGQEKGH